MTTHRLRTATHGDLEIAMKRVFDAPHESIFDALTRPELVQRWLYGPEGHSLTVCEIDLEVGGALRYVWRLPDGTEVGLRGVFQEIVRPERLVHTELFDEDWTGGETVVTTELHEQGAKTTLQMVVRYSTTAARDAVLESGLDEGMAMGFDRLDALLPSIAPASIP